ncbi:hypothetical protein Tco_0195155 [Tanacetum coccineum]
MLWGSPSMKASISFLEFGTMFGHKTANSQNLQIPGDPIGLFYSDGLGFPLFATGISLGPVFLLGLSAFAMEAAYASRAAVIPVISCRMASKVMASVSDKRIRTLRGDGIIHEVGDNDANNGDDDEKGINNVFEEEDEERIRFLGGNSSSGIKKYQGLNSIYKGNTRDRVKIAGEVIGSGDEIEFSKELKELLSDEAGK